MSEANNGGKVIQYNYKLESQYTNRAETPRHYDGGITSLPVKGQRWRYYPASALSGSDTCRDTEGLVASWNKEAGVVCTDAGEILIHG